MVEEVKHEEAVHPAEQKVAEPNPVLEPAKEPAVVAKPATPNPILEPVVAKVKPVLELVAKPVVEAAATVVSAAKSPVERYVAVVAILAAVAYFVAHYYHLV